MADEKQIPSGTNWLLGLDKLTSPTLDFFGIRLRDKLRAWLNEKARERILLRRFEKEFLYRQIDLLNYGNEQFTAILSQASTLMVERQCQNVAPLVKLAVTEYNVPPEKAFEAVLKGFGHDVDEPSTLVGGEALLYCAAASAFDALLSFQVMQMMFQFANAGSAFHLEHPEASDEEIEKFTQDEATLQAISDAMEIPGADVAKCFLKTLSEAYGQPFNESVFQELAAAADQEIITERSKQKR